MFVKEKYGKNQTAGRLVIRRLFLVASEENFHVSRLNLFVVCVQGRRNGQSLNVFILLKRLRIVNEGRLFCKENLYISKRNMKLFEDRVRSCH